MKTQLRLAQNGSVLVTAILTLTILSMICAVSLYVTSQNAHSTSQTASWQAALSGAESGVEQAYYALNKSQWTGWKTVSGGLPSGQPTGGTTTTTKPATGSYAYSTRTMQVSGEGGGTVKFWVTIDTAGLGLDHNGNQWYRIRATGVAAAPGPARVSNEKRDNDLRKISLRTDRISGLSLSTPQAARTIEVIAEPVSSNTSGRGITLNKWIKLSGSGTIDSFDSSNSMYSTDHKYDPKRPRSNADIGMVDSTGSDLNGKYVYGDIVYSGPAIKGTSKVQGTISSPFPGTIPSTSKPTWTSGTYTSYSAGSVPGTVTSGTISSPALIKINGDFDVGHGGSKTFTINSADPSTSDNAIIIWVTGQWSAGGNGQVIQDSHVKVTWYIEDDISVDGGSYTNASGYAQNANFIGAGKHKATFTGNSGFIGTLNAPDYDTTLTGDGGFMGSLVSNTVTITGNGGFHYDEALSAGSGVDNYSYASWFEDIADVSRGSTY
jgi:hypothetical protein